MTEGETATSEACRPVKRYSVGCVLESTVVYGLLLLVAVMVLVPVMRASMSWRLVHDPPFLFYMGYIMDQFGMVPYRDFFDVNMLGSYLSYEMAGRIFGFTDLGLHQADICALTLMMLLIVGILWRLGLRAGLASAMFFAMYYYREGPMMTFQRDFIALLPMSFGVACAVGLPWLAPQGRALLAGIGFGVAAAIKPHMAMGLAPVVFYLAEEQCVDTPGWRARLLALFWNGFQAGLGALVPVLAYVGYLVHHGALMAFLDSAFHYVPLYANMTGNHFVLKPEARRLYVLDHLLAMPERWPLIAAGLLGLWSAFANTRLDTRARRVLALLALLVPVYMLYPAVTGQFWRYHDFPMIFWLSVCAGLVLSPYRAGTPWQQRWIPVALMLFIVLSQFKAPDAYALKIEKGTESPKGGRVDVVAAYLKENLRPGDTVQPLDWVGGGMLQAMLYAGARPATPFLCYFHFFHHTDLPYIQNLRKRFMHDLELARPRFISAWDYKPGVWVRKGPRTSMHFEEAEAYIRQHYVKRKQGKGYSIYERDEATTSPSPAVQ